jgi:hypothetical protein
MASSSRYVALELADFASVRGPLLSGEMRPCRKIIFVGLGYSLLTHAMQVRDKAGVIGT